VFGVVVVGAAVVVLVVEFCAAVVELVDAIVVLNIDAVVLKTAAVVVLNTVAVVVFCAVVTVMFCAAVAVVLLAIVEFLGGVVDILKSVVVVTVILVEEGRVENPVDISSKKVTSCTVVLRVVLLMEVRRVVVLVTEKVSLVSKIYSSVGNSVIKVLILVVVVIEERVVVALVVMSLMLSSIIINPGSVVVVEVAMV
jgi:hypothetical protein